MSLLGAIAGIAGAILSKPKRVSGVQSTMEAARGAMLAQETYGINALELIRAGSAGTSSGSQPRVGSVAALTNSFDQIADVLTGKEARQEARDEVEDELRRIQLDTAKANLSILGKKTSPGGQAATVVKSKGPRVGSPAMVRQGMENVRPQARPTTATIPRRAVFLPDGQVRKVPADVAERLGIENFDTVAPGDYAEVTGEFRGEGETLIMAKEIGEHMGIPLTGSVTEFERLKDLESEVKMSSKGLTVAEWKLYVERGGKLSYGGWRKMKNKN